MGLIEHALWRRGTCHLGGDKIPNATDDHKDRGDGNKILVETALILEGKTTQPRGEKHQQIRDRHVRPEGDVVRHDDEAMIDPFSVIDP